jgi:TIR domain-containing protein/uncharacterized protein DUF1566
MAHDVFISHSSKDKAVADAVCATLEQHHIRCWIAPRDIGPGQEWGESIVTAIHSSRVMVLIFSASANESPQIRREVERAVHKSVVIVPMRIEDVLPQKSLEYFIGAVHWLDAFNKPLENYLENLAGVVSGILGGPDIARTPSGDESPGRKTSPHRIWVYAGVGIAAVLIAVLFTFTFLRKSTNPQQGVVTLGSGASGRPVAAVHLRSEKQTLSVDQAKVMVVTHNFFRDGWNTGGKGLTHQYESKVVQNALVVLDHATGLMWQRGGSGDNVQGGYKAAEDYVQGLNAKKFAGFDDWRLPTLEEGMSLMTGAQSGQPGEADYGDGQAVKGTYHIDSSFEKNGAPFIWTSDLQSAKRAWVVYFWDGICDLENLDFNAYVRAVRSLKSAND